MLHTLMQPTPFDGLPMPAVEAGSYGIFHEDVNSGDHVRAAGPLGLTLRRRAARSHGPVAGRTCGRVAELKFRIQFPPAESQETIGSSALEPTSLMLERSVEPALRFIHSRAG